MKKSILLGAVLCVASAAMAQNGAISQEMLQKMRENHPLTGTDRALHNALNTTDINTLALNADARNNKDFNFTYRVPQKGITNQRSSGRCWLFTGLNVLRAQAIRQHNLPELELSQTYNFFYDQLEKSNLFLQLVIDTAKDPMNDRRVEWIFRNPLADGGQFTGVADNLTKYGVVPASVMSETYVSQHTAQVRKHLSTKLVEWGLKLRKMVADGAKPAAVQAEKAKMLDQLYGALTKAYGVPPTEFTYNGKTYTPQSFYKEYFGNDLQNNYLMFMNDPTRPYYKVYEIEYDRHVYDGNNWRYLNVPMEDIKEMAIASIKDSTAMYFSCDVNKFLDRPNGTMDLENYDYGSILGLDFNMNKAERIATFTSASSHAMTLEGVDLNADGKPVKWLIENSWGPSSGHNGFAVATDEWMDEYLFRLVVEKRFVPEKLQKLFSQKATVLPCWDPMF